MLLLPVTCFYCQKIFFLEKKRINENRKLHRNLFCSPPCVSTSRMKRLEFICDNPHCKKVFLRIPSRVSTKNYCSRHCSSVINNALSPKKTKVIKYCLRCNKQCLYGRWYCSVKCKSMNERLSKEKIIRAIRNFYRHNQRVPFKNEAPYVMSARKQFGSWNKAIMAAGFPPNPVKFSNKYLATDGHNCDSQAEKIIDEWLCIRKIPHQRHVPYPGNTHLTADFVVKEYWLEYFGLAGRLARYDELKEEKEQLVREYKLKLISLYPKDLNPVDKLNTLLSKLIG